MHASKATYKSLDGDLGKVLNVIPPIIYYCFLGAPGLRNDRWSTQKLSQMTKNRAMLPLLHITVHKGVLTASYIN